MFTLLASARRSPGRNGENQPNIRCVYPLAHEAFEIFALTYLAKETAEKAGHKSVEIVTYPFTGGGVENFYRG